MTRVEGQGVSSENRESIRVRAEAVGLTVDEQRLDALVVAVEAIEATLDEIRAIPVNPVDLAMTPYDPAWPEERGR